MASELVDFVNDDWRVCRILSLPASDVALSDSNGSRGWRVPDLMVEGHVTLHRAAGPDQIGTLVGFEVRVREVMGGG
jgi:hypothetical protein